VKEVLRVKHSGGSYGVKVTRLQEVHDAMSDFTVVTDRNVQQELGVFGDHVLAVAPGEKSKSLASYQSVLRWLAGRGVRRDQTLVAMGGGVVGDLGGFAGATYMRGIPVIQVPTSLLAMVDSAVGGKVGIDLPEGKNLVGAFHQPTEVWIMPEALHTLPFRHLRNGLAEVLKYGFILDPHLIEPAVAAIKTREFESIVIRSVELKALVVEEDEFETTGRRAILNFGHTVGHAIEAELNYRHLLHGEAVAIGMASEAALGEALGVTPKGIAKKVSQVLESVGLPTQIPDKIDRKAMVDRMRLDKKATGTGLAFSLLTGWGECKLLSSVDPLFASQHLETL
jgi:3-dehydroquinate synthase